MQITNNPQTGPLYLGRGLGGRRPDEGRIQYKTQANRTLFTTQHNER